MGAAHTATLDTTAAILHALRKAHHCQQGVIAGREPTLQEAEKLPCREAGSRVTDLSAQP